MAKYSFEFKMKVVQEYLAGAGGATFLSKKYDTRKSRKYSSYKGKVGKVTPNRLHRRFSTSIPHQKITTDTSEFKYYEVDEKGRMAIKSNFKGSPHLSYYVCI